jgi:hypothetical protein
MDNNELINSHEVINDSTTPDQEAAFSDVIERLEDADYAAINDYLNAGVEAGSDWHDYLNAFSHYEWYEFGYAFKHVMGRDLSLD